MSKRVSIDSDQIRLLKRSKVAPRPKPDVFVSRTDRMIGLMSEDIRTGRKPARPDDFSFPPQDAYVLFLRILEAIYRAFKAPDAPDEATLQTYRDLFAKELKTPEASHAFVLRKASSPSDPLVAFNFVVAACGLQTPMYDRLSLIETDSIFTDIPIDVPISELINTVAKKYHPSHYAIGKTFFDWEGRICSTLVRIIADEFINYVEREFHVVGNPKISAILCALESMASTAPVGEDEDEQDITPVALE